MTKPDDNDYLWDRSGPADPHVARLEELLSPLAHRAPLDELRLRRRRSRSVWIVAGAAVVVAAALVVVWNWPRGGEPPTEYACRADVAGFAFTARGGQVACGGANVSGGVLPVGEVLDTRVHEASLAIADIGSAELGPKTRVRLDRTSPERHQLFLERGRMHARVSAPPRIFAVGTPGANVTDLGCEYTLDIDERGAGTIHVITGSVELETGTGKVVEVPGGTMARLLPGRRAGLPVVEGASAPLRAAVDEHDHLTPAGRAADVIQRILDTATPSDAITVATLADLAAPEHKRLILERLMQLHPAPRRHTIDQALERLMQLPAGSQQLTIDQALADRDLWVRWFDEIKLVHQGSAGVLK